MRFRKKLREAAAKDAGYRKALWKMCEEDVLFWLSSMAMCYEPRPRRLPSGKEMPKVLPFIPWDHQIPVIQAIDKNLGFKDIVVNKSRGEGASWVGVLFATHRFLFRSDEAMAFVSKDEDSGDRAGDMSSLLEKVVFELERALPKWMAGHRDRDWKRSIQNHTLQNLRNGAIITSYAATGDVASGGRVGWFFMDELSKYPRPKDADAMASTEPVTDSRLVVATPKGSEGAYYDAVHEPSSAVQLTLAWETNPTRNRGLYRFERGRPVAVDPVNNPLPPHYDPPSKEVLDRFSRLRQRGFTLEKGVRSEWFDERCDRPKMTPQFIAQEYERDFGGSSFKVFGDEVMSAVKESVRNPVRAGVIHFHPETLAPDLESRDDGQVKIWVPLNPSSGFPAKSDYVAGVDVSQGAGGAFTSNSVLTILDMNTREQVLEYATNTSPPEEFADECIALCKLFNNAYLAWEVNGPGSRFSTHVLKRKYPYLYKRSVNWRKGRRKTKELGFFTDEKTKGMLFGEITTCIRQEGWQIRSEWLEREMTQYVLVDGTKIIHQGSRSTEDDSTKGQAHGDRVIALGVAFQAAKDRPSGGGVEIEKPPQDPDYGTFGWRMAERERELRRGNSLWDGRSISEVARGERRGRHR